MTGIRVQAGAREWLGLAVIVLVTLLVAIDISVLGFALPDISKALAPSATQLLWIMDIYSFVLAGLLVTMGWVGDKIGRRKLLLIGAVLFGLGSAGAAFATSPGVLIGCRALLGVGAATLTPTSLALIRNTFHDSKQRKAAIGIWSGALTGGAAIGPLVGGLLLNNFWWGSVFLINVPVMVLVLVLTPILLPEFRDPNRGRIDLAGAALSMAAILPLIYGVKELALNGYSLAATISAGVGAIFLIVFVQRQRTTADPLMDVSLFRYAGFTGSILVNLMAMLSFLGISVLTNQYMQEVLGYSPFAAALWSLAVTPFIGTAIGVTTALAKKVRPGHLIGSGMLVMAAGFVVLSRLQVSSSIVVVLIGVGLMAAGMVSAKTLTSEIVITSAPAERAGASAAISETFSELGSALGFAVIGSIGSAVFHRQMTDVHPAGLSPAALRSAQNTIGGTLDATQHLPKPAGDALLVAGKAAFTHGLETAALTGAVAMVVVAAIVTLLLRKVPIEAALPRPAESAGEAHSTDGPENLSGALIR
jgi:DHA2 family multidrug resistance protein-like MFS transporter